MNLEPNNRYKIVALMQRDIHLRQKLLNQEIQYLKRITNPKPPSDWLAIEAKILTGPEAGMTRRIVGCRLAPVDPPSNLLDSNFTQDPQEETQAEKTEAPFSLNYPKGD